MIKENSLTLLFQQTAINVQQHFKLKLNTAHKQTLSAIFVLLLLSLQPLDKPHTLLSNSHITQRQGKQCATDTFCDENGVDAGRTLVVIGL